MTNFFILLLFLFWWFALQITGRNAITYPVYDIQLLKYFKYDVFTALHSQS